MPSAVTAYDVRIVPAGDAALASFIAREVISEWNSLYAAKEKQVLISLRDDAPDRGPADLLLAFYCPARALPGCEQAALIEKEIEAHVEAKRPVLVYCSEARDQLQEAETGDSRALAAFQERFRSKVVLAAFGDEKTFRSSLARQLVETIRSHAYFRGEQTPPVVAPPTALSKLAEKLLIEACADPEAYIGRFQDSTGIRLQANGKQLVGPGESAPWEKAFHELLSGGYIRDAGCQGRLFQISTEGFTFLKTIGVTPVGYIAELGGM